MTIDFAKQMEINSIINEMVHAGTEVFDREKAKRLRDLVFIDGELKISSPITLFGTLPDFSQKMSGFVPGVGNVTTGESEDKSFSLGDKNKIVCGNWSISYSAPQFGGLLPALAIENRFNITRESRDREGYRLCFDYKREPKALKKMVLRTLRLPGLHLTFVFDDAYKKPSRVQAMQNG